MSEFLDAEEFPFTYDEVYAAFVIISRHERDARESADEYRRIAEDERRTRGERRARLAMAGVSSPDFWLMPLEMLAALSLGSADAAARVERLRERRMPPNSPAFRAEEDSYWKELCEQIRQWRDAKGAP